MPENQTQTPQSVTIHEAVEAQNKQARIKQRKKFVKSFAIGAAIGFTVVTVIRMIAEVVSYDDTQDTED